MNFLNSHYKKNSIISSLYALIKSTKSVYEEATIYREINRTLAVLSTRTIDKGPLHQIPE